MSSTNSIKAIAVKRDTSRDKHIIGICGPPSSHKTTTGTLVRGYTTGSRDIVKEFARDWIERNGPMEGFADQLVVILGQAEWEERAINVYRWAISDSPQFLPYVYASMQNDIDIKLEKNRSILSMIYDYSLKGLAKYSRIYLLTPKPVVKDGVREQSDEDTQIIFDRIKMFLDMHVDYVMLDEDDNLHRAHIIIADMVKHNIISPEECLLPEKDLNILMGQLDEI